MNHFAQPTKLLKRVLLLFATLWLFAIFLHLVGRPQGDRVPSSVRDVPQTQDKGLMKMLGINNIKLQFLHGTEYDYANLMQGERGSENTEHKYLKSLRFDPEPNFPQVECPLVIAGNQDELNNVKLKKLEFNSKLYSPRRSRFDRFDDEIVNRTKNCSDFLHWRKYINKTLSQEETNFPIAYVITIHKKLKEFERLLRAIYRPNNIYCIHVDKKSSREFHRNVSKVTSCFSNVFVVSEAVDVHYSHYSRVQADINCLKDLQEKRKQVPWRYVINLCGQDFPLKTNFDIVKSLQMLYGSNNLETIAMPERKKLRYEKKFKLPVNTTDEYAVMTLTNQDKEKNPLHSQMFAGSAYFIFSWRAIQFILTDPTVARFLEWNKDTYSPDEHIWATLQRWHPFVPGSFPSHPKYDRNELISLPRLVKWFGLDQEAYPPCEGKYSRGVCVYGAGDLTWLLTQAHLFANKFDLSTDPFAITCLDDWLRNRTIAQALNRGDLLSSPEQQWTVTNN